MWLYLLIISTLSKSKAYRVSNRLAAAFCIPRGNLNLLQISIGLFIQAFGELGWIVGIFLFLEEDQSGRFFLDQCFQFFWEFCSSKYVFWFKKILSWFIPRFCWIFLILFLSCYFFWYPGQSAVSRMTYLIFKYFKF